MGFLSSVVGSFTGSSAARSSRRAAQQQIAAEERGRQQLIDLQEPFIELGRDAIPGLQTFIDDPTGASFLQGNPMFDAAIDNVNRVVSQGGAAAGRFNSGGITEELFNRYLATGDSLVNSAFNRAIAPITIGQNAASLTGTQNAASLGRAGAARAGGTIGAANARAGGVNNLITLLGMFT